MRKNNFATQNDCLQKEKRNTVVFKINKEKC